MLNLAKHEIFPANKYENTNNCWHFHIYKKRKFHPQLFFSKKELAIVSNLRFTNGTNVMGKILAFQSFITSESGVSVHIKVIFFLYICTYCVNLL